MAETLEIKLHNVSSITEKNLDEKVKIQGSVNSIRETPGLIILEVDDGTGTMKVVLFKEDDQITLNKYDNIELTGKVIKYKNYLEIEAETIQRK
jgi:RecJ-like exonuclease